MSYTVVNYRSKRSRSGWRLVVPELEDVLKRRECFLKSGAGDSTDEQAAHEALKRLRPARGKTN